ncbi:hypothetical protein ASG19_07370 [Rhizobium sp. Leaf306]|uniref:Crp/Fnr family transcriptional regulator n=1 Tax=Rhizobium sp. Leaf306 TaxID=1736330 RepID=UPI0007163FC9|nr:Crp/Fnr family transcriptional regulator [Rhizobium sp. Leaf306]KQQ38818.1 hypothetical protein ASG19_07370 [Rhizobium sp. Leaf306]
MTWTSNGLLQIMPENDLKMLEPHLQLISLNQGDVLFEPNSPISHVYFFESGLSSEIAVAGTHRIEVGCIGREGCSGIPVILGSFSSPHRSFMQGAGEAHRIEAATLRRLIGESVSLSAVLLKYAHVFMIQIAATALADGRFDVEKRLARWVLMSHDRLGDTLTLTHDFLALMLGVRRPSVTDALHKLEGKRAIRSERSVVTVLDRPLLEQIAGEAYGTPEAEYRRLFTSQP